jgi:hypothetical protein
LLLRLFQLILKIPNLYEFNCFYYYLYINLYFQINIGLDSAHQLPIHLQMLCVNSQFLSILLFYGWYEINYPLLFPILWENSPIVYYVIDRKPFLSIFTCYKIDLVVSFSQSNAICIKFDTKYVITSFLRRWIPEPGDNIE